MTEQHDEILQKALALPDEDRADLASQLYQSLSPNHDPLADEEWVTELNRRIDDIEAGRVTLIPWTQVRESIQKILKEHGAEQEP